MSKISAKDYDTDGFSFNYDYLGTRIIDSVVVDTNKNRLVYIRGYDSSRKGFVASEISDGSDSSSTYVSNEHIDLYPPNVGYFNYEGHAGYLTLLPRRQWKQGITKGQLAVSGRRGYSARFQFMLEPFYNKYPSFVESANMVSDVYEKVAFHRKLAIDSKFHLHYRSQPVGKVNEDNLAVTLSPDKNYLTEYLMKEGVNVC